MAGAGYKLFQTGAVLTAADVNTYLNEQTVMVFANSTARTTALSSVLAEGMMSYLQDTNAVEVYNGSAWVSIGSSGDITGVTAGTGLSGGGTSGDVTLSLAVPVTEARGGTNQTTYTTGDLLYASGTNTLAKRGIGTTGQVLTVSGGVPTWSTPSSGTPTYRGVSVYRTAGKTISNNTWTVVDWTAENFDSDSYHDNSTNNTRFTVPSGYAGKYSIQGNINWDASSTSSIRGVSVYKNGSYVVNPSNTLAISNGSNSNNTSFNYVINLAVGDYVEIYVYHNNGGNLTMTGGSGDSTVAMSLLGA